MREEWRTQTGFVLATIGSAVGLGNIWRFSYVAGESGGGAFLAIYLVFVVLIGLPLMIAEFALGRRGGGDVVQAFSAASPRWRGAGWLLAAGALVILSYYTVIAGWVLKYLAGALSGTLWTAAQTGYGAYFARFIANTGEPVLWQAAILLIAMLVVAGGVRRGIERLNMWLMPLLAVIVVLLALFALTLPGAGAGVRFLLAPDWSVFARPDVYVAAIGQAFFSLGVGMAVMITYASYMGRQFRIPVSATAIVGGDTLFAVVAGLAIFPAVFALGGNPAAGPELAFITLPQIFLNMPFGSVVAPVFFFLLAAAALTSMVSLLEVPVAVAVHRLALGRRRATLLAGGLVFLLGLPSALSYGLLADVTLAGQPILDAVDRAVSSMLLPLGGLLVALCVGWAANRAVVVAEADLPDAALARLWVWLLRVPVPLLLVVVFLRAVGAI